MAKHKFQKALQRLSREIFNLFKRVSRQLMQWLLRSYLVLNRLRSAQAGFVLPTLALMMIVVFLVVAAVMFRTFSRNTQVIRDYQTQQVANAASPALDRAKAKIEFMFREGDWPGNPPNEADLERIMSDDNDPQTPDLYTFPGETRVTSLDGVDSSITPNVWRYTSDQNTPDTSDDVTTVYGILSRTRREVGSVNYSISAQDRAPAYLSRDTDKANRWLVRNGPLATTILNSNPSCNRAGSSGLVDEAGWVQGNGTGTLYKNIQVYAVSIPTNNTTNKSISTVQYQQDRISERANKWGAWFRYDLEAYPGQAVNWNGAMHSQGSIFLSSGSTGSFRSYLISSPSSCFFTPETSSKITAFGEVVAGRIRDNTNDAGRVNIDVQDKDVVTRGLASNGPVAFSNAIDSITPNSYTNVADIATDPVALHVSNKSLPRVASGTNSWNHDATFETDAAKLGSTSRITVGANAITCAPYVDDLYRADNRLGPKPSYSREKQLRAPNEPPECNAAPIPGDQQGESIELTDTITTLPDKLGKTETIKGIDLIRNDPTSPDLPETVGLDGYWERRARNEGLRIIVGERLELGNPYGWLIDSDNSRPNPPPSTINTVADLSNAGPDLSMFPPDAPAAWAGTRRNEARQLRTLQDNLAAVQATAIYHSKVGDNSGTPINEGGYFPVACLASTVHPGTAHTLAESSTFQMLQIPSTSTTPTLLTDFFYGKGTNGWEFNPPAASESSFATLVNTNTGLRKALNNLAHFAGDPNGAFPTDPTAPPAPQDNNNVHPYPNMTMWGNFSKLRQVMDTPPGSSTPLVDYGTLSIADKSYLHTAACTLGLLAYNINYINDSAEYYLQELLNNPNSQEITDLKNAIPSTLPLPPDSLLTPDYVISELERQLADTTTTTPSLATKRKNAAIARILHLNEQIKYDRSGGAYTIDANCDWKDDEKLKNLCAKQAKFPALYYLFPTTAHAEPPATGGVTIPVPGATTRVTLAVAHNRGDNTNNTIRGFNNSFSYQVLSDPELEAIALSPREFRTPVTLNLKQYPTTAQGNTWQLPNNFIPNNGINDLSCDTYPELNFTPQSTGSTPASQTNMLRLVNLSGTPNRCVRVGFKDSAIFDGREMMSVRLFNLDLDLMRTQTVPGLTGTQQDTWLPTSGLVYAFREDAVREDAIARSAGTTMNVWNNPPQDPAKVSGISPKPVDYYPDPDRRPYGFRLRNGADLRRIATNFTPPTKYESRGLSLISDNPVYIQGDFNLHTDGSTTQEEFGTPLLADYSNFYTRTNLNNNFARPASDRWRTSEILADSITILSNGWSCDGTIQSGIRGDNVGCASGRSSYRNSNFNFAGITNFNTIMQRQENTESVENIRWGFICENPFDPRLASLGTFPAAATQDTTGNTIIDTRKGCDGPIKVFRTADIRYAPNNVTITSVLNNANQAVFYRSFHLFSDKAAKERWLNTATQTTVNTILVSGVIPTRQNGSNGGFHNFPRLLEDWNPGGRPQQLAIAGSMLQLNFSNYATGPYDQDAWEPGAVPGTSDWFYYYRVPQRRWGYDTALQIAPPSPAAARLAQVPLSRSEFYREPPADDPYICKLRKVVETNLTCPN